MTVVKYDYVLAYSIGGEKPKVTKDKMNVEMFHKVDLRDSLFRVCDFHAMILDFVYLERKVICISLFDVLSITLKANKSIKTNFLKTNFFLRMLQTLQITKLQNHHKDTLIKSLCSIIVTT